MVGYTNTAIFKPGDFCYIVAYTVVPAESEKIAFLEGMVTDVDLPPVPKSIYHPLWKFWDPKPDMIRSIGALVIADPRGTQNDAVEPLLLNQEPPQDYLVITPGEHEDYLYKIIHEQEHTLDRRDKFIRVQQRSILTMKKRLEKYTTNPPLQPQP